MLLIVGLSGAWLSNNDLRSLVSRLISAVIGLWYLLKFSVEENFREGPASFLKRLEKERDDLMWLFIGWILELDKDELNRVDLFASWSQSPNPELLQEDKFNQIIIDARNS